MIEYVFAPRRRMNDYFLSFATCIGDWIAAGPDYYPDGEPSAELDAVVDLWFLADEENQ